MREILLRGKDIKGNWHIGLLAHIGNAWYISNSAGVSTAFEVIPDTIGQYTGLTANGKKIFEGDIVKTERDLWHGENKKEREILVSVVRYDEKQCSFGLYGKYKFLTLRRFKGDFNEVIGNIHDNPELLKGGD